MFILFVLIVNISSFYYMKSSYNSINNGYLQYEYRGSDYKKKKSKKKKKEEEEEEEAISTIPEEDEKSGKDDEPDQSDKRSDIDEDAIENLSAGETTDKPETDAEK